MYLSKKGIKDLKKTIAKLEKQIASEQVDLKNLDKGDDHEDRLALTEKLSAIESLRTDLQEKIYIRNHAKLLPRRRDVLKVALGSIVEMVDQKGRILRYQLVDSLEANPSDGRISIISPLGRELLGRQIKDFVEWGHGSNTMRAQLLAIQ